MKQINVSPSTTMLIALVLVLCSNALIFSMQVDSRNQRKRANDDRKEIICILKIEPHDRVVNPKRVEECHVGNAN